MRLFQPDPRRPRTLGAVFVITIVMATLLTAFFHTQVVRGKQYTVRSESNRLRPVVIPAPRGTIHDRNGEVVATSTTRYSVSLLPAPAEAIRQTLVDLAPFLGLAAGDVEALMDRRGARPHDLLTVTDDATFPQAAALEERRAAFGGVMVVERPRRHYPAGAAIGHVVGYVGEITREELGRSAYRGAGYRQGRMVGKAGIEKQYELHLGGEDGARFVEVDAMGRVVDPRASVGALAPEPGEELRLTLDLGLQEYVHDIFPDTMKGAVVAMVPSTGEILALYSHPTFDPNDFVDGIRPSLWSALRDDPMKPLLDRTTIATYPPASTFKTVVAAIGVRRGLVTADTRMPLACTGGMAYAGRYARCWKRSGHGSLTLAQAIEKSCNVYFYQLGIRLGLRELTAQGTRMGFGRKTGIDLPVERSGRFPTGPDWYRRHFGYVAPSEVMSLAIGQGPNDQTVLRMAHFYSAIAGNGSAPGPHLVATGGGEEDEGALDLGLTAGELREVWAGLELVTRAGGTGVEASLERWQIYGKTGTAQNPPHPDHGWFVGFSGKPGRSPEIVVAAIVEHGLHGDDVATLAAKAINFYLDRKYGHPFDPRPTLVERWSSGRKPWGAMDRYPAPLVPGTAVSPPTDEA
ncbi:MAG TPA: penicillin-binding protein 2 [Longimicrobiaceae bacterium]|nr:penicillin-binding protein 2 [Longimicrobiaceae bacterium]